MAGIFHFSLRAFVSDAKFSRQKSKSPNESCKVRASHKIFSKCQLFARKHCFHCEAPSNLDRSSEMMRIREEHVPIASSVSIVQSRLRSLQNKLKVFISIGSKRLT
jgi:hypothetical protein